MDVFDEAVDYLQSMHITVDIEAEGDVLEEDVFHEETVGCLFSPLQAENGDLPMTPKSCSPEEQLERRLLLLRDILRSEELFLSELDTLLMPMKALQASAGTSQPVLSSQQVMTVFYQVPELHDIHRCFYTGLKARLGKHEETESSPVPGSGSESEPAQNILEGETVSSVETHRGFDLTVGDLYLKMVSQIGVYRGFIDNYEDAVEIVRKCTHSDERFRTLAQSMMSHNGSNKAKTKYTFEALLYKPLDRITRTTLVIQDLLKTTPVDHSDYAALQEVLRLSRSFLSGVNERSQCKWEVTLSHEMRRQLIRDGFVVDVCEGERQLRHLFLYTDLLLCVKPKAATKGKQTQYKFCWYMPLAGLRLRWATEQERPADTLLRLQSIRAKMWLVRHQGTGEAKGLAARNRKKLEQMELMLLTHAPVHRLDLQSPSGKSHSVLPSSLCDLADWREAILKLTRDNIETVPPDLITLTSTCGKLRMTQRPPLCSTSIAGDEEGSWCGTLSVAVHSASGLQEPGCMYVCVEVDGYGFYEGQAQTHSSVQSLNPHWDQEFSFLVDGAHNLGVLCVCQADGGECGEDVILGKASIKLQVAGLENRWRRQTLCLGRVEVDVSLRYRAHPLDPPSAAGPPKQHVYCVPIGLVAQQEGVLVPHVVRCCVEEVERRGLDEVGIYRLSGAATEISNLKAAFNSNLREAVARLRRAEVNAVSGVLKLYFRELPEPLIPSELFQDLAKTLDIQDSESRLGSMLSLLQCCADVNRYTFLYLLHHLKRVSERQEVNKMSLLNLATVFGPSLLRPPVAIEGHNSSSVDISQEVVVQVQVVFFYLQCENLPLPQTSLPRDDEETTRV